MNEEFKKMAINLFNETWDLIDKVHRTNEENIEMIHKAHTSLYLWSLVGTPTNLARGEWQISHVYSILSLGDSALLHAKESLKIVKENHLEPYDKVFAYEAIARAHMVLLEHEKMNFYRQLAFNMLAQLEDIQNREYAEKCLETIK